MFAWVVGVAAATVALAAVVGAVALDRPARPRAPVRPVPVLPTGRALLERAFTLRWRGYDPYEVDVVLTAAADALDALAAEAGAQARERAEQRLLAARGEAGDEPRGQGGPAADEPGPSQGRPTGGC